MRKTEFFMWLRTRTLFDWRPREFRHFLRTLILYSAASAVFVFDASGLAQAENTPTPTVTREAFVTEGDVPIQPLAAAQTNDGGLIIAGRAGADAWAAKTDANGKVLWNYFALSKTQEEIPLLTGGFDFEIRGIAPMADGSVYLCGFLPRPPNIFAPALLTHIDAQGHVIKEQLLVPSPDMKRGAARFDDCIPWNGGVAVIGQFDNVIKTAEGPNPPVTEHAYWLLALDSTGQIKLEKQIPEDFFGIELNTLLVTRNGGLVFSTVGSLETELISFGPNGDLLAKKQLPGRFEFVRPVVPDGILQVVPSRGW